jgi:hypothetical protein
VIGLIRLAARQLDQHRGLASVIRQAPAGRGQHQQRLALRGGVYRGPQRRPRRRDRPRQRAVRIAAQEVRAPQEVIIGRLSARQQRT